MPNHLAQETSPYLLQHALNPVAWYAWGPEPLDKAQREDKPIFLSIGYSACHWCHVMEHESFENEAIAAYLNQHFVSIKVDREERPDLDQIYMSAVQMLTGRGGWPLSVFLTPDLQPFFGGTYWPATARLGMPGFDQVLTAVVEAWQLRRPQAIRQAADLTARIANLEAVSAGGGELRSELLAQAERDLMQSFDPTWGGFGTAPKFPQPLSLQLALRLWRRTSHPQLLELVRTTLDRMRSGGIYDHLAGGFARYSVDERWLVPHFEKMLYDNALLADAYLDGYCDTGCEDYAVVVRETLDYLLRDMRDAHGGFHSAEDADSEGEEGKFYLWTPHEVVEVLGPAAAERFCYVYDVSHEGNFEQRNILHLPRTLEQCGRIKGWAVAELQAELRVSRQKLRAAREQRVRPGKDDKILVSWNALAIQALARAAGVVREPRYLEAATAAAEFLLDELQPERGHLLHSWCRGVARQAAFLDDYACLINALLSLHEASLAQKWLDQAICLADNMLARFHDPSGKGFYFTAGDHEQLIVRPKELHDSATPSGNSVAAAGLLRLARLCGRTDYWQAAEGALQAAVPLMRQSASASAQALSALDSYLDTSVTMQPG